MKTENLTFTQTNTSLSAYEKLIQRSREPLTGAGLKRFSTACLEKLNHLKEAVNQKLTDEFAGVLHPHTVRQVVNEADALAASTPFPSLFLPTLAEEKVLLASQWQSRQRAIQERFISSLAA